MSDVLLRRCGLLHCHLLSQQRLFVHLFGFHFRLGGLHVVLLRFCFLVMRGKLGFGALVLVLGLGLHKLLVGFVLRIKRFLSCRFRLVPSLLRLLDTLFGILLPCLGSLRAVVCRFYRFLYFRQSSFLCCLCR